MKAARLRFAANTRLKVIKGFRLEAQLGRKIAKNSVPIVTSLAIDTTSTKAYITRNIEKIRPKKGALKRTGSSTVAIDEGVLNAAYMTVKVEIKRSSSEHESKKYPCTAGYQRIISSMCEVCMFVRNNTQGVKLVTSLKTFLKAFKLL